MADELSKIDLSKLTLEEVKKLKNQAIERLKGAGGSMLEQVSHQDHGSHSNHTTHGQSPQPLLP